MAYLDWSEDYSVKVREIDEQHKNLVTMINSLYDAMVTNKGREVQKEVIGRMVAYAGVHFETEEQYMRRFSYPDYPSHKVEHDKFTTKAMDLKERAERAEFILTLEILQFLKEWLQNHILGTDSGYISHFNQRGVS